MYLVGMCKYAAAVLPTVLYLTQICNLSITPTQIGQCYLSGIYFDAVFVVTTELSSPVKL